MIDIIITMWQVVLNYYFPPWVEVEPLPRAASHLYTELRRVAAFHETPKLVTLHFNTE